MSKETMGERASRDRVGSDTTQPQQTRNRERHSGGGRTARNLGKRLRGRRSSNPLADPTKVIEEARMKDEDDVPQNMEDFVFEVVKRAKEDEQRDEMAFNYSNQNRNKRKFILSPDGKWKRRWD